MDGCRPEHRHGRQAMPWMPVPAFMLDPGAPRAERLDLLLSPASRAAGLHQRCPAVVPEAAAGRQRPHGIKPPGLLLNPAGNGCLHGLSRAPLPPICASPPRRRAQRRSIAGRCCPWSSPPRLGARICAFPAPSGIAPSPASPLLAAVLTAA